VTIAAAVNSPNPAIRNQVPEFFHRSQTLILCPPSLIDNWYEEFLMWTPKEHALGPIRKIAPSDQPGTRIHTVESWHMEGGILILSYHLFRNWVEQKTRKNQKYVPDAQVMPQLRDYLLKDPRIIVADEAHQMKNKDSILAQAASLLESKSRIALTGSPLANNLIDYYAMVNWISPKYLDEIAVFRDKYLVPIEQGLFSDSTYAEQRKSLKKLQILKEILNPKINRADISVLKGSLPMKVEFVITVPLTEVQKKAYNQYATSLLEAKSGTSSVLSTTLLSWLAVLGICCNHPSCFYDKLAKRAEEQAPKTTSEELADQELFPGEVSLGSLGFNEAMWVPQKEILSAVPDLDHPRHSYRAEIFKRIVEESVLVGDKILCFSQSIPTLDYLERLLQTSGVKFSRLDGSTAVRTRQAAIKEFNNREDIKVYLISTRAGGLGLNITGANRVIIFDFGFNPTWEEQAVGRAYRLGQKKPVYIYRFLSAGTFEEIIHNKSIFKTQLAMRVVDKKNVQRSASKSLGEYLFPVKDVKNEDISDFIGKDRDVLDKILLANDPSSPSILKIALTETFRKEHNEMLTEDEKKEMEQELEMELLRMSDPAAYERKMLEPTMVYPGTNLGIVNNYNSTYNMPIATPPSTQSDRAFFKPPPWAGNQTVSPFVPRSGVPSPSPFSQPAFRAPNGPPPMHHGITSTPTSNGGNSFQDPESVAEAYLKSISTPKVINNNSHSPNLPPRPPASSTPETRQPLNSITTPTPTPNNNRNPNLPPRPPAPSEAEIANGLPGPVSAEALTARLGANDQ
jgi:superfamily II DNA or RNA helicase